jgi:diacylglycerol kinase family enzyme
MRRILLLVNSRFESRRRRDLPPLLRVFNEVGIEVDVQESGQHRAAGDKAKQAVAQGVDAIVVGGGDGTVFDVLQGLAGSETPLGILPYGTGNVLAQNLRIPKKPLEAARWLIASTPRTVPLAKITCCFNGGKHTWFFAMAAGMGGHAAMIQAAERFKKNKAGRAAYFAAGLKILLSHPVQPFDLEITTVEGKTLHRRVSEMVAVRVAELNLWRPGGHLDFPFLRLASIEGESRWQLARAAFQALFLGAGKHREETTRHLGAFYEDALRVECKPIPGRRYQLPIVVEADGEILGASCATIEMAGVDVRFLSQQSS